MRNAYLVIGTGFVVVGLYAAWEALGMTLFTEIGPGSGFFPFSLGVILAGLSMVWLIGIIAQPTEGAGQDFLPQRAGVGRIAAIVVSLFLFALLADTLGFQLTMFVFLLFLLVVLGRQNPLVTLLISIVGSFGIYYVFKNWLDVQLPASSIEFLRNLGL